MFLWSLALLVVAVVVTAVKLVQISMFWTAYGIPFEPFARYLYRIIWLHNTRVIPELVRSDVRRYGPVYGSYRGTRPALIVSDMKIAEDVMIQQFGNFFRRSIEFRTGNPLWDTVITNLSHDAWRPLRALMGHAFAPSKLRAIVPRFDVVSKRLVKRCKAMAKSVNEGLVLNKRFKSYAVNSMAAAVFGLDVNCIDDPDNELMRHASAVTTPSLTMLLHIIAPGLSTFLPWLKFPPEATSTYFSTMTKRRLAEKRKIVSERIAGNSTSPDILDLLIGAQAPNADDVQLTDDVLAAQAVGFFTAGIDSMALTLDLVTYFLAVHPDAQQRAYREVKNVMDERNEVAHEDLSRMRFLKACLLESMRLMPLTPLVDRICTVDSVVNGIKIRKGTLVEFPLHAIHMDPRHFPQPERFLPQRFFDSGDISEIRQIDSLVIFGEGPKSCVGRSLAMMNMETVLANLLLNFRFEPTLDTPPYPLRLKAGLQLPDFSEKPLIIRLVSR